MAATIKIKNSSTSGAVPTASDLVQGELAVNVADLGLYTENASGTVVKLNAPSIDDKNTGATKHLTISTGGNMGLGVTPSAWGGTGVRAFQISGYGSFAGSVGSVDVYNNAYYDGSAFKYISSNPATRYSQNTSGSSHAWFNAPVGTAGNSITFTQAMTLDASGNLGVGTTSPSTRLHAKGSSGTTTLRLEPSSSTTIYTQVRGVNGDLYLEADAGNAEGSSAMIFTVDATERARIDSSGNLLVGTTSASKYGVDFRQRVVATNGFAAQFESPASSTDATVWVHNTGTSGTRGLIQFVASSTTTVGKISTDGSTTTYGTSSDYRLKEDISPMVGALSKVSALKPVTYKWKHTGADGEGFIAHELAEVCPSAVVGDKDEVDLNGNPVYQGIDTSFLVATLTAAIQEQQAIIETLTARITALEQA